MSCYLFDRGMYWTTLILWAQPPHGSDGPISYPESSWRLVARRDSEEFEKKFIFFLIGFSVTTYIAFQYPRVFHGDQSLAQVPEGYGYVVASNEVANEVGLLVAFGP